MTSLLQKFVRRVRKPLVPVTFYTRKQCCCCENAMAVLRRYQRKYRLEIAPIDIDGDPELVALFGTSVPVVAIDGKVRFRGIVNPMLLERLLQNRSSSPEA